MSQLDDMLSLVLATSAYVKKKTDDTMAELLRRTNGIAGSDITDSGSTDMQKLTTPDYSDDDNKQPSSAKSNSQTKSESDAKTKKGESNEPRKPGRPRKIAETRSNPTGQGRTKQN